MTAPMNRRDAVKTASLLIGSAIVVASGTLSACRNDSAADTTKALTAALSTDDQALIEAIADTILPDTAASPGAKAAGAGAAINLLLTDCHPAPDQDRLRAGLTAFRTLCKDTCGTSFATMPQAARETLLRTVDAAARKAGPSHWFHLVRDLTLRTYFSSEIGMTKALRYVRVPGKWTGCVALTPGQPAWG